MNSKQFAILAASIATLMFATVSAQSPPTVPASALPAVTKSDPLPATMNSLRELKDANEQILKKQEATLAALDELQKTADQIKIFSKRG